MGTIVASNSAGRQQSLLASASRDAVTRRLTIHQNMSEAEALLDQAREVASLKNVKVIRVRIVRCGTAWLFTSSPMPRLPVRCEA